MDASRISQMKEWPIKSQGLIKDGWKVIGGYINNNKYKTRYVLLECIYCGYRVLKTYYPFMNHPVIPCNKCLGKWEMAAKQRIGQIIGPYKILDFVRIAVRPHNGQHDVFYRVECTKCGSIIDERMFCESRWKTKQKCAMCSHKRFSTIEEKYKEYKSSARARHHEFKLSLSDFDTIVKKDCYYCGDSIEIATTDGINKSRHCVNGIDRIDNSKGYTLENCVPCCGMCNRMKSTFPQETFYSQIRKIYSNLLNKV